MKHPVARYLMCSYAYYVEAMPLVSDAEFDQLAKDILKDWNTIEHQHKNLISKHDLEAGTYLGKYPTIVKGAVASYRRGLTWTQ